MYRAVLFSFLILSGTSTQATVVYSTDYTCHGSGTITSVTRSDSRTTILDNIKENVCKDRQENVKTDCTFSDKDQPIKHCSILRDNPALDCNNLHREVYTQRFSGTVKIDPKYLNCIIYNKKILQPEFNESDMHFETLHYPHGYYFDYDEDVKDLRIGDSVQLKIDKLSGFDPDITTIK